jgi:hypothetical protein
MRKLYKYLLTIAVGLALVAWVAFSKDIFAQTSNSVILGILSDSFLVPGVLISGFGGLIFVSNEGVFDGITYGLTSFFDIFRKDKQNKYRTFFDYRESKGERDTSFGYLLICGLSFLALSGLMIVLM